ncbi:MAG: orotidine-5'-phosphate decarboxylase [Trueperaceae bacterium]
MSDEAPAAQAEDFTPGSFSERSFTAKVAARTTRLDTRVCLGIDPRPSSHPLTHPERFAGDPAKTARAVVHYFQAIIEATADKVACYKLQSAFFELLGVPGLIAMAQLLADIRATGVPVILDAKRGDIGSTAQAYASAYLTNGVFNADALTVNPYLGLDTLKPFVEVAKRDGRGVLVLLKTSNSGSGDIQDQRLEGGKPLWEHLAGELDRLASEAIDDDGFSLLGAVAGATYPEQLAAVRRLMPRSLLLVPGYGAQGGSAGSVAAAFAGGGPAVVSASRSLTYVSEGEDFAQQAQSACERMRDEINAAIA